MRDNKLILALLDCAHLWTAASADTLSMRIEPQPLSQALNEFAKQTGLQVLFPVDRSTTFRAPEIDGTLTPEAALERLLAGSDLQYQFINSRTVAIHCASEHAWRARTFSDGDSAAELQEVVVTAQRREERSYDVPVSITDLEAIEWLQRLAGDSFEEDRGNVFVRWMESVLPERASALTLLLHTPLRTVAVKFRTSQFRRLHQKFSLQASRVLGRHLLEYRNRRRPSRPSLSIGFSQVQRLVV
jgi:hypothetical protein